MQDGHLTFSNLSSPMNISKYQYFCWAFFAFMIFSTHFFFIPDLFLCKIFVKNYGQLEEAIDTVTEDKSDLNLYLHIGPGKMATATIQDALREDKIPLNKDGYCIYDPQVVQSIIGPSLHKKNIDEILLLPKWHEFKAFLEHCFTLQQNVLLSSEFLGLLTTAKWEQLMKPLFTRWNFHLIVGYRRWYAWFPSAYFQIFRSENGKGWPDNNSISRKIPALVDWYKYPHARLLFTENYIKHWKHLPGNEKLDVLVYNMHLDQNVMKTFYCNMFNDTQTACLKYSINSFPSKNIGYTLEYDRLAMAAYDSGIVTNSTSRQNASRAIQRFHEEKLNMNVSMLPRKCLTQTEMDTVFSQAMAYEKKILPAWYARQDINAVSDEFYSFARNKLCSVDVSKTLQMFGSQWKDLFLN